MHNNESHLDFSIKVYLLASIGITCLLKSFAISLTCKRQTNFSLRVDNFFFRAIEIIGIFVKKMNSGLVLIAVCYFISATLSLPVQNGAKFYFSVNEVPVLIVNKFSSR